MTLLLILHICLGNNDGLVSHRHLLSLLFVPVSHTASKHHGFRNGLALAILDALSADTDCGFLSQAVLLYDLCIGLELLNPVCSL